MQGCRVDDDIAAKKRSQVPWTKKPEPEENHREITEELNYGPGLFSVRLPFPRASPLCWVETAIKLTTWQVLCCCGWQSMERERIKHKIGCDLFCSCPDALLRFFLINPVKSLIPLLLPATTTTNVSVQCLLYTPYPDIQLPCDLFCHWLPRNINMALLITRLCATSVIHHQHPSQRSVRKFSLVI